MAGAALIATLFAPWYGPAEGDSASAWEAFAVTDLILLLSGLGGIALLVLTGQQRTGAVPIAVAAATDLVAVVAAIVALIRILSPPGADPAVEPGAYLGLGAALLIAAGAFLSMRDEGFGIRGSGYTGPRRARRPTPLDIEDLPAPPKSGG
jgi:uncharacterized membrane protein